VDRLLDELARDLRDDSGRPLPARRVPIPKPGRPSERRPLSIPSVRDRIVQAALKIVIEPIFEAGFLPCSFGFRPKRAAHDALQVLVDEAWRGRRWVVESDIASCFEAIPHDRLMAAIEERVVDRQLLKLLRSLLRAGVMEDGTVRKPVSGTPQGGVVSPLLCNVYLHRLDRAWQARGRGVLCRYADDLVVMCKTEREARGALEALRSILAELGVEPKEAKTRIVYLAEGGEGIDFLGFHHRRVRGRTLRSRHIAFLARWPSRQAMQHARDRIRELTHRSRLRVAVATCRAGERLPARLGRLLPVRQRRTMVRHDPELRPDAPGPLRGHAPSASVALRMGGRRLWGDQPRPDQPRWQRHRAPAQPGLAGEAECRR
jgi:RNA-directed DNA polymerase